MEARTKGPVPWAGGGSRRVARPSYHCRRVLRANRAVRAAPEAAGGMAPIYGLAASGPDRTLVSGFLEQYMDRWYVP